LTLKEKRVPLRLNYAFVLFRCDVCKSVVGREELKNEFELSFILLELDPD
jgi:hypothetical protein